MKRALQIILLFGYIFIFSCNNPFAPALIDETAPRSRILTLQKTPKEVLDNFRYAYTFKDSLVYSEIFDSTFIFSSFDYNQTPPQPIEWGRDTELRTTARMFRYFNTLDVVWNTISNPDTVAAPSSLHPEEDLVIEHTVTFTLTLDGGRVIPPLIGDVLFRFVKREFIRRGKTDYKYYISLWKDQKI